MMYLIFIVTAYCTNGERVSMLIKDRLYKESTSNIFDQLSNIEKDKFKDSININEIIEMLSLILDGYIQNKYKAKEEISVDE